MKSICLLTAAAFCLALRSDAQVVPEENLQPVNYESVRQALTASSGYSTGTCSGKHIKENEAYFNGRWLWYWRQHTDRQGNLVSPLQTLRSWRAYKATPQAKMKTTADPSNWTFTGPDTSEGGYSGIGRINTMAFHPTNASTYWVGSAGGGAWKTTNNGQTWSAVADYLPSLSVSDIDFNPVNPNTVYMCTGDRDGRDHYSIGVLKSYDGGLTWDTTALTWPVTQMRLTNSLVINKLDTNCLILAASDGIYRSFDGGQSFVKVYNGNFKQVLYHPTDTSVVYATSFFTYANNTDAQIFRSADGGNTWAQVTNLTSCWRIELAVTPGNVAIVKAVAASRDTNYRRGLLGVYSSSDTGKTFQTVKNGHSCTGNILSGSMSGNNCFGQGNYDLCIAIHPSDPNKLYIGGVNTWYSANGGASWQIVNQWWGSLPGIATVHADKHHLGFHPLVPGRLFECNDGGIYYTDNPQSQLWSHRTNGMGITQFYRNAVADISLLVLGGSQDNGTKGLDNGLWTDLTGGDGMECLMDPSDPNTFYTSIQYGGAIYKFSGSNFMDLTNGLPFGLEGGWITPFVLNAANPYEIIAGYQDVFVGDTWGGWTNITNGSLSNKNILRLGTTPAAPNTLYVLPEDSSVIWYSHNYGQGLFSALAVPYTEKISDLKVAPKDKDHIYICFSGYGPNKVAEYTPVNGWSTINQNLPDVPVLCMEIDSANGVKYIGTDVAVFYRADTMSQWQLYSKNLPSVHITDLGINYASGELWAATYGRGMWVSPRYTGPLSVPQVEEEQSSFRIYPNPAKEAFTVRLSEGSNMQGLQYRIYDVGGRLVADRKVRPASSFTVPAAGLKSGTYIVEVLSDGKVSGRQKLSVR